MKNFRIAFICLIMAACLAPSVLLLCGFKNANRENRPLAKLPELMKDGSPNLGFASGFDKFMDDNFALREYLVTACNTATAALIRDYNGESAVIGRQGTLYYSETLDDHLGVGTLSPEQIAVAADYLKALSDELAAKGTKLVFIAAPNKASVYPEYMPRYLKPAGGDSNLELLNAALAERGVAFIDAKRLLIGAKEEHSVYYLRDSHWNNYGATLVYNAAAELLGLETYDPNAYETAFDYRGDLVNFVYPSAAHYEERLVYSYPREYAPTDHQVNFDMFKINETTSEANGLCLLMYHDSFGKSLQPIFSPSVGRLVMIKSNSPAYSAADAEEYGADAVIIELVERNLDLLYEYALNGGN